MARERFALAFKEGISYAAVSHIRSSGGKEMARKTILVCDNCSNEVEEGKGAVMRITFNDARRGAKQADLCDSCSQKMPGQAVARRGRRPKAAA
jgi:hypothetical protein